MFAHNAASNSDAGVMSAFKPKGSGLPLRGLCALGDENARGGLEIDLSLIHI